MRESWLIHTTVALCLLSASWLVEARNVADSRPGETGVVVMEVSAGSALAKAGVEAGDVLLSWRRSPAPPADPDSAEGKIESIVDWFWFEVEQAPRGTIQLAGERRGTARRFEVEAGSWDLVTRPRMPPDLLNAYLRGKRRVAAGDLAAGVAGWRELADVARDRGDEPLRWWLYLQIGDLWTEARQWQQAKTAYRSALEGYPPPVARAAVWDALGRIDTRQDFSQAEANYRSALEIWRATGESLGFARSYYHLALLEAVFGRLHHAEEHARRALTIQEKLAPESLAVATSMSLLGTVLRTRGEIDLGKQHLERAFEIRQRLAPGSRDLAASFSALGMAARNQGELDLAKDYHEQALAIQEKLSVEAWEVAQSLNHLGNVAMAQGEIDVAERHHRRALEMRREFDPESSGVATSLNNLGNVAFERGELGKAREYAERALEVWEKAAPGSLAMAYTLHNLGDLALQQGQLDLASGYSERAVAIIEVLAPESIAMAMTLKNLGGAAKDQHKLDTAAHYFNRAVDVLESQLENLGGSQDTRSRFLARYAAMYRTLLELQLDVERPEEAFTILERYRARSFLTMLGERDLLTSADISPDLENQLRDLAFRYDQTLRQQSHLNRSKTPELFTALSHELRRLQRDREAIIEKVRKSSPQFAAVRYPRPLGLRAVREALDPGTVMLSYSVGKRQTDLFVVTRDRGLAAVETLDVSEETLRSEVERLRRLLLEAIPGSGMGAGQLASFQQLSRRLYERLVQPVTGALERGERVLIIPDGPLHFLPFAALLRETSPGTSDSAHGRQYLVEWKPLHFALSATVYAELKKTRRPAPRRPGDGAFLVAFGDPHFPEALQTVDRTQAFPDVRLRSAVRRGLFDWSPLPHTHREVEEISELYTDARIYLGEAATEERAKSISPETGIVHFATHSYLDDRHPLNSALVLTLPPGLSEDRDNGLLQAWEIFERVRLDADLVVLSACQSALGEERGGEGLVGLTRAFQYAGARTVAATLWSVADQTTSELMVRFYRHLKAGKAKDQALQAAQVELIRGPIKGIDREGQKVEIDASAPFYWAAFQIIGDWQ